MYRGIFLVGFILLFSSCGRVIPTPQNRLQVAQDIATHNSLQTEVFKTKKFDIFAYETSDLLACKEVHVYIEGDGFAWVTSSIISDNPTPLNPIGLKLMAKDNFTCKLYLARPCQYKQSNICKEKYWTNRRFSKEILDSYNEILDKFKFKSIVLFGYSGGGAIATLLSASREDVKKLVTIAGNLDIEFWAKKHYLTPLKGSLNPINFAYKLQDKKQIHLIGGKDTNVDKSVFYSYESYFMDNTNIKHKIYKDFTHSCCWVKEWKQILKEI